MTGFKKTKVGIIGSGNIGTDLLFKVQRSELLECSIFCGRDPESQGLKRAAAMGVRISADSIKAIENEPGICEIVFDTTSAKGHFENAPILKRLGKFVIDLTPSRVGQMCVPAVNMETDKLSQDINMVSCGGQACVPIAKAIMDAHPEIKYIEVVGTISSKSAGPATRSNIDEYIQTTQDAIKMYSGVPEAKAILVLNPAEPPIWMHNTVYAQVNNPDLPKLREKIGQAEKAIQKYVPGYKVIVGPIYENGRLTVVIQVEGQGDFLPKYSGNLDIITCAAVAVAETYVKQKEKIT